MGPKAFGKTELDIERFPRFINTFQDNTDQS